MADRVDEAAERLYGLPRDEFTAARNDAAKELRGHGLSAEADEVKALPKPSAAAWALNQLTRRRHADLDEFLELSSTARDLQLGGASAVEAREAVKSMRNALDRLVAAAGEALGGKPTEAVMARIRQTLEAAAVDDEAAEELRRGRLAKELEPAGFGTLAAHAKPAGKKGKRRPSQDAAAARKVLAEARERLREAEDEYRAATAEERQAHRRWQQAQHDAEQAAERVEKIRRELEDLRAARP